MQAIHHRITDTYGNLFLNYTPSAWWYVYRQNPAPLLPKGVA